MKPSFIGLLLPLLIPIVNAASTESTTSSTFVAVNSQSADTSDVPKDKVRPAKNQTYKLCPGDTLSFQIEEDHEEPKVLTISPSGHILIPQIGRHPVSGLTIEQASQQIKTLLEKDFYHHAQVNLSLQSLYLSQNSGDGSTDSEKLGKGPRTSPQQVIVVGQIKNQGALDMPPEGQKLLLSRALLKCGGFASFANSKNIQIVRRNEKGELIKFSVDAHSIFNEGRLDNDIELKPDDMVIVPEKFINF